MRRIGPRVAALALAAVSAALGTAPAVAAAADAGGGSGTESPCPLEALVRGEDQRPAAYAETARAASEHPDPACRAAALAAMALVDRVAGHACGALERIDLGAQLPHSSAGLALEAELAWRCGHPRRAHRAARDALQEDSQNVLADTVLGRVLEARLRTRAGRAAFARALGRAPKDVEALRGMARLTADRAERRVYLERYLDAAPEAGEPFERRLAVIESIALDEKLAGRTLWTVDELELPGRIRLRGVVSRPGEVSAWLLRPDIGERERVPTLLDSGASGLHLSERAAERAEMESLAGGVLLGGGGDARHAVERGVISRLDFGPVSFGQALGVAAADDLHPRGVYRALVGFDLFSGLRLVLDPEERELWLHEADRPEDAGAAPERIDPWPLAGQAPILRVAGQMLVPVTVRDAAGLHEHQGLALFDTGAERTMISPQLAEAIGGPDGRWRRALRGYGGRLEVVGAVGGLELELDGGRVPLREVPVVTDLGLRGQLAGAAVSAVVGLDAIGYRRVVVDLASGWLTLSEE